MVGTARSGWVHVVMVEVAMWVACPWHCHQVRREGGAEVQRGVQGVQGTADDQI